MPNIYYSVHKAIWLFPYPLTHRGFFSIKYELGIFKYYLDFLFDSND
jgi:hypothetical protein